MSDFSRADESRLLTLLMQQTELFGQIRGKTQEQKELLAADDIVSFELSLAHRQELIEQINGLHQESELLMQSYLSLKAAGKGKSKAIDEAAVKLREIVSQCVSMNDVNTETAKTLAEDYIKHIGKLTQSRKSIGAYAPEMPVNPERFDTMT